MTPPPTRRRRRPRARHRLLDAALHAAPPAAPPHLLPPPLRALRHARAAFRAALDAAFPPLPPRPPDRRAALDSACDTLARALRPLDAADDPAAFLCALAESGLIDDVAHALKLAAREGGDACDAFVLRLLRALNACTTLDILTKRMATHRLVPTLFTTCRTRETTDLSLALIEELLLHAPHPLDLSTIPNLARLVPSLSPFHLGTLCRVLAPLVDERDAPLCAGDHCSGQCAFPDWRQIDDAATALRHRRSYADPHKFVRDRNHAALLAVPCLIPRLVKLISVPPARRQDLVLVDHAVLTGVFSMGVDMSDVPVDAPLPAAPGLPTDEQRQRIIFMVFRRLTGTDADDADVTGADSWHVFDRRVADAELAHARSAPRPPAPNPSRAASPPSPRREGLDDVSTTATASDAGDAAEVPQPDPAPDDCPMVSINGMLMSSHQIEVLFVLYSLLIGKRKADVQRALIAAGILPALNRFCDALDWSPSEHETRTEDSLKVHFIRLLHYLCDGLDDNTLEERQRLLFTQAEQHVIRAIEDGKFVDVGERPSYIVQGAELPLADLQRLSLHSSPCGRFDTSSSATRNERESHRVQLHICPLRPSGLLQLPGDATHVGNDPPCTTCCKAKQPACGSPALATSTEKKAASCDTRAPADPERGLISKMVTILMNTLEWDEVSNTRRYLLSGCIETFQRSASLPEKTFIARQGLLAHLVEQLSETDVLTSQVSQFRQTSFDLLGQLIKWNRDLFNDMNEQFHRDHRLLDRLLKAVSDRLVDSNVFVRSVALSLERFRAEDALQNSLGQDADPKHRHYDFENCKMWEFVETYRVRLVHDLLSSVRVEDITFENICCVNTALILFVVSCRDQDSLDDMLSKLADLVIDLVRSGVPNHSLFSLKPIDVIQNFSKLVEFWLNYYRHQGVDVFSLEVNTNIRFDLFVEMANALRERLPAVDELIRKEVCAMPLR